MRKLILAAAAAAAFAAVPSFAGDTAEETCYRYFDGNGAEPDYTEALSHCREAAEQGKARAQYLLGQMIESGKGTAADQAGRLNGTGRQPIRSMSLPRLLSVLFTSRGWR